MKSIVTFLSLGAALALSLGCAAGGSSGSSSDNSTPLSSGGSATLDTFGSRISDDILESFKTIPGGTLTKIGEPQGAESSLFTRDGEDTVIDLQFGYDDDAAVQYSTETNDGVGESQFVGGFSIMNSEVTVGMFVDFLNNISGSSEDSGGEEDFSTTFSDELIIYKPVMQDPLFCGIGRQLGGETVVDAITDYGGFFILSKSSQYTDPFSKPQKARQNTEGDISSTFFAMFDGERGDCSEYPMVFVSQSEAKEFCQWLGPRYRLPTWQEWSWAAKGGEEYNFGTSNGNIISNPDEVTTGTDPVYLANIQGEYSNTPLTKRIKSYGANKYGLYDMTGNVSEWTYFIAEDETEGATLPSEFRHIMGGNFSTRSYAASTTWARYGVGSEGLWGSDIGFRVVYDVTRASSFAQSIDPIP